MIIALLLSTVAGAGTGPWTLAAGDHDVFVGSDYSHFRRIGRPGADTSELGTGLNAARLTGVWTGGVAEGFGIELLVPFKRAWATDPGVVFCQRGRPEDWCAGTGGLANVSVQFKARLLDEQAFRPITLSAKLGIRTGAAYSDRRGRLTTLGDGQTDLGVSLTAGRTDTVGKAWYRVSMVAEYWFRFRVAEAGGRRAPGDEISGGLDAMGSPKPWLGLGVSAAGFHRLWGLGLSEVTLGDEDAWVSLAASQVRLGPKLAFYINNSWTFFSSAQFSVFAKNAPNDMVLVSVGVGKFWKAKPPPTPQP